MLTDIPYKNIMGKGRYYDVWVLRDVYENTFVDIAKEYNVSVGTIVSNYEKALYLKTKYYVNHLSIVHGYENTAHFRKIWKNALDCYCGRKYIVWGSICVPPSPGVRLSRCCAYQGSFLKSSKSVVNSLSISAKVPVFQGFSEIIKVVLSIITNKNLPCILVSCETNTKFTEEAF